MVLHTRYLCFPIEFTSPLPFLIAFCNRTLVISSQATGILNVWLLASERNPDRCRKRLGILCGAIHDRTVWWGTNPRSEDMKTSILPIPPPSQIRSSLPFPTHNIVNSSRNWKPILPNGSPTQSPSAMLIALELKISLPNPATYAMLITNVYIPSP